MYRASGVCPQMPEACVDGSLTAALDRAEEAERLSHSESAVLLLLS